MMQKVLVIHGPNLNLLGEREPGVYGNTTFADLNRMILSRAEGLGLECEIFQSNHEGAIIDKLHAARTTFDGVIINAELIPTTAMPFMMPFTIFAFPAWKYISAISMHGTSSVLTRCSVRFVPEPLPDLALTAIFWHCRHFQRCKGDGLS